MKVRETVKEVLSYGLSPAMYPYFFQKIDCMLQGKEKVKLILCVRTLYYNQPFNVVNVS